MKKNNDDKSEELLKLSSIPIWTSPAAMAAHRLSRLLLSEMDNLLKSNSELSLAGWRVISRIGELGKVSQKELVEYSWIEQAQVSRALSVLEKRGYLTYVSSEKDRRIKLYSLTREGEEYRKNLAPIIAGHHKQITEALTTDEMTSFLDMCERIAIAASDSKT